MSYHRDDEGRQPRQIPIPGLSGNVGVGDVVERITRAVGIRPCSGCQKRKLWLNGRWVLVPMRRE